MTDGISLAAHRPYAYLAIVAGGTSLMYHLDIGGLRFRDLRLAPATITRIFTRAISNWNDPQIAADDPGVPLPDLSITPVIRSDGSGTSAQLTAFFASQTPADRDAFCASHGLPTPCPPRSLYPIFDNAIAQQGSDGVANYVAPPYTNGSAVLLAAFVVFGPPLLWYRLGTTRTTKPSGSPVGDTTVPTKGVAW